MVDFTRTYTSLSTKSRKIESFVRIYETSKRWNFLFSDILSFFILEKKVGLGSCYLQKYDYYGQNVKAVDDKSKFTSVANFEEVDLLG